MSEKKTVRHNFSYSYGSYLLEYSLIIAELNLLLNQKLHGIYCILSVMSSLTWFLFIRQRAYQEGVFRYQLKMILI